MDAMYKRLKAACYTTNISMSVVINLSPLLFLTFRSLYGISYSLLGLLVTINYVTQLSIDLVFSFFSHKFNIPRTVKMTPVLTALGLMVYAVWPLISPETAYAGIVVGTVIFSVSGGLSEVLISPVIAAIPAKDPDREMSKLHSVYAWGVVAVIVISTLYLMAFGAENWYWLAFIAMLLPLFAVYLFSGVEIPAMKTPERTSGAVKMMKHRTLWLCFIAMFLGGASEGMMAQWSSSYLEQAISIPKVWGDILGTAMFAVMLGLGRTLYAKYGKNIGRVLFVSSIGATVCYLTTAVAGHPAVGLIGCALTGLCTAMMWPGCLIAAADFFPAGGVFIFAAMAAGGDMGASVGPQLIGIITDATIAMPQAAEIAARFSMGADQLGMRLGMIVAALFPLVLIPAYYRIMKRRNA